MATTGLLDLPPELLVEILKHLEPNQVLSNVAPVCGRLYETTKMEDLWRFFAQDRFGIKLDAGHRERSARVFYKIILHKYGDMIGLWRFDCPDINGRKKLVQVTYDGRWGLAMLRWVSHSTLPLTPYLAVTIRVDWARQEAELKIRMDCALKASEDVSRNVSVALDGEKKLQISFWGEEEAEENETEDERRARFKRFRKKEFGGVTLPDMLGQKALFTEFDRYRRMSKHFYYKDGARLSLEVFPPNKDVPVKPGFFKKISSQAPDSSSSEIMFRLTYRGRLFFHFEELFTGQEELSASLWDVFDTLSRAQQEDAEVLRGLKAWQWLDWRRLPACQVMWPPTGGIGFDVLSEETRFYRVRFACKFGLEHFVVFNEDLVGVVRLLADVSLTCYRRIREDLVARRLAGVGVDRLRIDKKNK